MDYDALTIANSERAEAAEARGDAVVDARPMRFVMEFTADCNLHCFMCDCEMLRNKARDVGIKKFALPVESFRKLVEHFFPSAHQVNPTVVGEPFVLGYFDELLDACEKYSVKLDLHTNGMLMRGDRLRKLMPHLAEVRISFDGGTKPTFDHVRTGAKFERVVENLAELAALRKELDLKTAVKTAFNVTILKENVDELAEIVSIAHAHDIDHVRMSYLIVFGEEIRSSSPFLDPAHTNRGLRMAQRRAAELGVSLALPAYLPEKEPDATLPPELPNDAPTEDQRPTPAEGVEGPRWLDETPPKDWQGRFYCRFPWKQAFVNLGGDVAPCCGQGRPIVGNLFQQDFDEIWNGAEYQRLRRGLYEGEPTDYCKNCSFLQETGKVPYDPDGYVNIKD